MIKAIMEKISTVKKKVFKYLEIIYRSSFFINLF